MDTDGGEIIPVPDAMAAYRSAMNTDGSSTNLAPDEMAAYRSEINTDGGETNTEDSAAKMKFVARLGFLYQDY